MTIVPMARDHTKQVAKLHLTYLQTRFSGRAGCELLSLYYTAVTDERGGYGYVAISDGILLGYICGIWDAGQIRKNFIRFYGIPAIAWSALQMLTSPELLLQSTRRLRAGGVSAVNNEPGYELRPIVVVDSARGTGLASRLLDELLVDASRRGFANMHLITEEENLQANAFYRKNGFQLTRRELRLGQTYFRYIRSINEKI